MERASASHYLEMPLQRRSSTWGIPFSWFTLIYAIDRMEVVETNAPCRCWPQWLPTLICSLN